MYYEWGPHQRMTSPDPGLLDAATMCPRTTGTSTACAAASGRSSPTSRSPAAHGGGLFSQLFPGDDTGSLDDDPELLRLHAAVRRANATQAQGVADFLERVVRDEDYFTGCGVQRALATRSKEHVMFGRNEGGGQRFHTLLDQLLSRTEKTTGEQRAGARIDATRVVGDGARVDVTLVAGGKYHDIDFARRELLGLLAEHEDIRVRVQPDYDDFGAIIRGSILVSYTCDVRPSLDCTTFDPRVGRVRRTLGRTARHQRRTRSRRSERCRLARVFPLWADTLGSQFVAHPPIQPYRVEVTDADHWLVAGIEPFETDDELYLSEYHDRPSLLPLLHTTWSGQAHGFVEADWTSGDSQHLVMYLRPLGAGAVLYNTLGHCRGHYDMLPVLDYYPVVERCSWDRPVYYELSRRSLRGHTGEDYAGSVPFAEVVVRPRHAVARRASPGSSAASSTDRLRPARSTPASSPRRRPRSECRRTARPASLPR